MKEQTIQTVQNMIVNSGFETNVSGTPSPWGKYQSGTKAIFTYPETPGRDGTGVCISMSYTSLDSGKEAYWSQIIGIDHTKTYNTSGWVKMNNIVVPSGQSGGATIFINWLDSSKKYISGTYIEHNLTGTKSWINYPLNKIQPPSNAYYIGIYLRLKNCTGKVWFDDIFFGESGSPTTGSISCTTNPSGAQIYLDGISTSLGTTPLTLTNIVIGTHYVIYKLTNYQDCRKDNINVITGEITDATCTMIQSVGSIYCYTKNSAGASLPANIYLDGNASSIGIAPLTLNGISTGNHSVKYKYPGYNDCTSNVIVSANQQVDATCIMSIIGTEKLNKEVQVFYPRWTSPSDQYLRLRYDLISTIIYTDVKIKADGSLSKDSMYNPDATISYAHSKGVRIILGFVDYSRSDTNSLLANSTARTNAINNLLQEVKSHNFDGVNNDLELASSANKGNMTLFQKELFNTFRNSNGNYYLSMDIGASYPDVDKIFDVNILQNYVNYIMIMGYDWYGAWESSGSPSGPNSPNLLDSASGGLAGQGNYDTIKHYESIMDKHKLLFGVPYYGYEFNTVSNAKLAAINGDIKEIWYKDYINYVNSYNPKFDSVWQTPWYARQVGSQWYQGHYDDMQSLGQKYDVVNSEDLGGIGIWNMAYSGDRTELWDLIHDKFATLTT